jgi:hypothetical protein
MNALSTWLVSVILSCFACFKQGENDRVRRMMNQNKSNQNQERGSSPREGVLKEGVKSRIESDTCTVQLCLLVAPVISREVGAETA